MALAQSSCRSLAWQCRAQDAAAAGSIAPTASPRVRGITGFGSSLCGNPLSLALSAASSSGTSQARHGVVCPRAAQEVRTEQKVRVKLGPYRDGAISATVPAPVVTEPELAKALLERQARTHQFERINFTGTGAAKGHTVKINFEGTYAEGPQAGQPLKGTKAAGYELELKEREDEPWRTIVNEITVAGMGQEESKTFLVQFPGDYKAKTLAGVKARFTVTVKEIGVKKELPQDTRPQAEQRAAVEKELQAAAERRTNEVLDAVIRSSLLASSEADVEKVAQSVTWAKFGEKSLQDFKWNVLQEEVARVEGVTFEGVMPYLRSQARVSYIE